MTPPIRTMVVDDHEDIAVMFETLLAFSHDFTVVSRARDGQEALDKLVLRQSDLPETMRLVALTPESDPVRR